MIPVEQTRTEIGFGNCWQACLASIFEVPLSEVPDWNAHGEKYWGDEYDRWLAERNLCMMEIAVGHEETTVRTFPGYYIMAARSPRFSGTHAVVCHQGKIVWDPHPLREMGVGDAVDYTFFCPLDPAKCTVIP
ncbi:MAG TPA: hypothetical protein VN519_06900 [Bryobacteraceae bacterium]|nr:hypothetical protein [Bryobacteraceae bacterium]